MSQEKNFNQLVLRALQPGGQCVGVHSVPPTATSSLTMTVLRSQSLRQTGNNFRTQKQQPKLHHSQALLTKSDVLFGVTLDRDSNGTLLQVIWLESSWNSIEYLSFFSQGVN